MELVAVGLVNAIAWISIAAGALVAGWWVVGLYGVHSRQREEELPEVNLPAHLHELVSGVPPFLLIFIILVAVCMVAYVVSVWLTGVSY